MAKTKVELQNYQGDSLSPITIASNVLYEDGRNAQEVFEEYSNETFTPTIENSSSMFKVGQGDNVDYSENVVNGAYESMVLKGKSMVNCIQESSSQDVVLPYEFEDGQYVTINDTKESGALGIELKGQTLVNLINSYTINAPVGQTKNWYASSYATGNVKAGKYILIYNLVKTSQTSRNTPRIKLANNTYLYHGYDDFNTTAGIKKWIFTADSDLIEFTYWITDNEGDIIVNDFILLEYQEGMENWDIPFFEGMASVKAPVLKTSGKNLFDGKFETYSGPYGYYEFDFTNDVYTYSITDNDTSVDISKLSLGDRDKNNKITWIFDEGRYYDTRRTITSGKLIYWPNTEEAFNKIKQRYHIQIEEGSAATPYEPYKSNILSTSEDVVLRAVGEVRDELNLLTGEVINNVGKFIFDGTHDYGVATNGDVTRISISNVNARPKTQPICDKLKSILYTSSNQLGDELACIHHTNDRIDIYISTSKCGATIDEIKAYLTTNPITVQYQLKTESVKTVDLNVVDQNGSVIPTLKSWNTTTHIYSEIPENSLHPILSHSNPSYPVILKPSTKYSIVANSYSNGHTNSPINFNLGGATASTTVGNRVTTITTPSTLSNELLTMSGRGNKLNNVMVIEGDVVGDEPYFEGICDCKTPILSNVGKNLFDEQSHSNPDNFFVHSAYWSIPIRLKGNTEYRFSYTFNNVLDKQVVMRFATCKWTSTDHSSYPYSLGQVLNRNITSNLMGKTDSMSFVTPADGLVYLHYYNSELTNSPSSFNLASWYTHILKDIQLEESSTSTPYEPYKSNILSFDQKDGKTIVLRSLPNGVCDTLNVETGEYVQRVGEIVLDGSEDEKWTYNGKYNVFVCEDLMYNKNYLSTHFLSKTTWNGVERFDLTPSHYGITSTSSGREYLSQNPITVQYELATPIVSTIDVQGFPHAYANGHIQLTSGSIEPSLTPKVEYSVATNRNGQIRSNQKMVERHQKQLDQLQAIILANMVNTQYQQTLTTLNYDLLKKEVGE